MSSSQRNGSDSNKVDGLSKVQTKLLWVVIDILIDSNFDENSVGDLSNKLTKFLRDENKLPKLENEYKEKLNDVNEMKERFRKRFGEQLVYYEGHMKDLQAKMQKLEEEKAKAKNTATENQQERKVYRSRSNSVPPHAIYSGKSRKIRD